MVHSNWTIYSYYTLGLVDGLSSSLNELFPSMVHPHWKPYCSFVSFNFLILSLVRLSVINIFLPLKTFLVTETLSLSTYYINLAIMGLDFLFPTSFLKLPTLCVPSICPIFIIICMSDFKVFITKSSVSSSFFH